MTRTASTKGLTCGRPDPEGKPCRGAILRGWGRCPYHGVREAQKFADELRRMPSALTESLWHDVDALLAQAGRPLDEESDVEDLIGLAVFLIERPDEDEIITAKAA